MDRTVGLTWWIQTDLGSFRAALAKQTPTLIKEGGGSDSRQKIALKDVPTAVLNQMPDIYSNKEYALAQTAATHYNTQLEFTSNDSAIKSVGCLKRLGAIAFGAYKTN